MGILGAFFFFNFFLIQTIIGIRYPSFAQAAAAPFTSIAGLGTALAGLAFSTTLMVFLTIRSGWRRVARPLGELLLFFPLLFAIVWIAYPIEEAADWLLAAPLLLFLLLFSCGDFRNLADWRFSIDNFPETLKTLVLPTIIMVLLVLFTSIIVGLKVNPKGIIISLATYPLYAWGQLFVFLLFPVRRFKQISRSPWEIVLVTAGLFALIHWPNAITMFGCFAAMLCWASIYLKKPNLHAIAISMGIAATAFSQLLPPAVTGSVSVGPGAVHEQVMSSAAVIAPRLLAEIEKKVEERKVSATDQVFADAMAGIALMYPLPEHRKRLWSALHSRFGGEATVAAFLRGEEFRRAPWLAHPERATAFLGGLMGWVDTAAVENGGIAFRGWAGDVAMGAAAEAVFFFREGELVTTVPCNEPRSDVASVFDKRSLALSGFRVFLPGAGISDGEIRIFAVAGGKFAELTYNRDYPFFRGRFR
ncbi:MAG: hypothetical protein JW884_11370 [Deltaproteobacteria bacterium]|nr:hypothetical protein [Deltaproteobacteria bacterium]